MAEIIFLGTAASIPTARRDNTAFLFSYKKEKFLIDCPGAIVQKLLKVGIDFRKIKNIIVTHEHPDHLYGIISLIHTQMFFNKRINIFSSLPSIKIIKHLVRLFRLNKKDFPKLYYFDVFKKNPFFKKNSLTLLAIKNKHIPYSFGIKFIFGKKSLFYSSDTAFSKEILDAAQKINYLIHDCSASSIFFKKHPTKLHTPAKTLAEYLKDKREITLIPVHFLLLNKKEMERIKRELLPLKERVIFVKDLEGLKL